MSSFPVISRKTKFSRACLRPGFSNVSTTFRTAARSGWYFIRHSRIDGPTRPSSSAIVSSTAIHWSRSKDAFIQNTCTYVHIAVKRGSSPEHSEWKSSMPPVRGAEPRQPHRTGHGAVPRCLRGLAGEDAPGHRGCLRLEPCLPVGGEYDQSCSEFGAHHLGCRGAMSRGAQQAPIKGCGSWPRPGRVSQIGRCRLECPKPETPRYAGDRRHVGSPNAARRKAAWLAQQIAA